MGRNQVSVLSAVLYLRYVDGMAFCGRPCGPAHSALYYDALRVVSPRPGPAGPGSIDAVCRDLAGHGCLEEGYAGHVASAPPAPERAPVGLGYIHYLYINSFQSSNLFLVILLIF